MPVAVCLSPHCHFSPGETNILPLASGSWIQWCWGSARCRTPVVHWLPWQGFSFPDTAARVWDLRLNCSHISHPRLMVWGLALNKGGQGFGSHLVVERLWSTEPKSRGRLGASQCVHVGGSSRAAGVRDWAREFGLAASAQGCWRRVLGADHCCNCWSILHGKVSRLQATVKTVLRAETRIAEKKPEQGSCKGQQLGKETMVVPSSCSYCGSPSNRHSHNTRTPHPTNSLCYKMLSTACFTVLLRGHFCELRDPEHSRAQDQHAQITPKGSKPILRSGSPGQWFPQQQQSGWARQRQLWLQPHGEADRELMWQKTNPATKGGV